MELQNTTLDDLAAVIGFSATLRLAAWFGARGNLYIPDKCEEGQLLVRLIGMPAAQKLTQEWGHQHISVPRLTQYETDLMKRQVGRLLEHGMRPSEVGNQFRISERRVQQICRELESYGLIEIIAPKNTPENDRRKTPQENPRKNAGENASGKEGSLPSEFFGRRQEDRE